MTLLSRSECKSGNLIRQLYENGNYCWGTILPQLKNSIKTRDGVQSLTGGGGGRRSRRHVRGGQRSRREGNKRGGIGQRGG